MHVFVDLIQLFSFVEWSRFFPQCTNASVWLFYLLANDPSTIVLNYGCVAVTDTLRTLILRKSATTIPQFRTMASTLRGHNCVWNLVGEKFSIFLCTHYEMVICILHVGKIQTRSKSVNDKGCVWRM
jgi:hypothetical protein